MLVRGLEVDRIRPDLRKNKIGTGAANAEAGLAKVGGGGTLSTAPL